ncbi:hypothetical protein [Streptomyces subrutilus]|uniref:hypothetical protein n=1 Tax=Streptomyces subrutilus TaxID=36818 RepID=UPI002E0F7C7B|nr:hypothetical protein OG479_30085 [Streptomyces subrutilus]
MRTRIWAVGLALGAVVLAGGATTAVAAGPAGVAPAATAPAGPVLIGYYETLDACFAAGQEIVGEHACVRKGARWALYVYP